MTKEQEKALKLIEDSMNKKCNGLECKVVKNNIDLRLEIIRLNRQIDLMAEEINETDRGYTDYCEMKIECDRNCKDCIKRYYERKSEK